MNNAFPQFCFKIKSVLIVLLIIILLVLGASGYFYYQYYVKTSPRGGQPAGGDVRISSEEYAKIMRRLTPPAASKPTDERTVKDALKKLTPQSGQTTFLSEKQKIDILKSLTPKNQ